MSNFDNKIDCSKVTLHNIPMSKFKIQKPFLKWIGGKTQIIYDIMERFPKEMNNYHELFLGGGSVLFALLSLQKENRIVVKDTIFAYDINNVLITPTEKKNETKSNY